MTFLVHDLRCECATVRASSSFGNETTACMHACFPCEGVTEAGGS